MNLGTHTRFHCSLMSTINWFCSEKFTVVAQIKYLTNSHSKMNLEQSFRICEKFQSLPFKFIKNPSMETKHPVNGKHSKNCTIR